MTLAEQIYAQAVLLTGGLEARQEALARLLAGAVAGTLTARLRRGLTEDDCRADLVAAGSLYTLAALTEAEQMTLPDSFTAGDLTLHRPDSAAAVRCLRSQAELIVCPYMEDSFSFRGV